MSKRQEIYAKPKKLIESVIFYGWKKRSRYIDAGYRPEEAQRMAFKGMMGYARHYGVSTVELIAMCEELITTCEKFIDSLASKLAKE